MWKAFWKLRTFELLSSISSRAFTGALTWHYIKNQGEPVTASHLLSIYFLAKILSGFLLSPLGDRTKKSHILLSCALINISIPLTILLALTSQQQSLYLTTSALFSIFLLGISDGLISPTIAAIIPQIIKSELITKAMNRKFTIDSIGGILAIGMGIISLDSIGLELTLCFITLIALIGACVVHTVSRFIPPSPGHQDSYIQNLMEGFALSYQFRFEFRWNTIAALANFAVTPLISIIIPYIAQYYWHGEGWKIIQLEAVLSLGILISATLVYPKLNKHNIKKETIVRISWLALPTLFLSLCFTQNFIIWNAIIFSLGIAIICNNIAIESTRTLAIPAACMARIQTIHHVFILALIPLGFSITGFALQKWGLKHAMLLLSATIVMAWLLLRTAPKMTELLSLDNESLVGAYERLFPSETGGK